MYTYEWAIYSTQHQCFGSSDSLLYSLLELLEARGIYKESDPAKVLLTAFDVISDLQASYYRLPDLQPFEPGGPLDSQSCG